MLPSSTSAKTSKRFALTQISYKNFSTGPNSPFNPFTSTCAKYLLPLESRVADFKKGKYMNILPCCLTYLGRSEKLREIAIRKNSNNDFVSAKFFYISISFKSTFPSFSTNKFKKTIKLLDIQLLNPSTYSLVDATTLVLLTESHQTL